MRVCLLQNKIIFWDCGNFAFHTVDFSSAYCCFASDAIANVEDILLLARALECLKKSEQFFPAFVDNTWANLCVKVIHW